MVWRSLLKALALPPAFNLLLLLAAWLCWRRWPRLARFLGGFSLISFWLLSTPWVATVLMQSLEPYPAIESSQLLASANGPVGVIVILAGGRREAAPEYGGRDVANTYTLERVRYGARLSGDTGLPLLVTGGRVYGDESVSEASLMVDVLQEGFGQRVRWQEERSRTTRENTRYSAELLKHEGIERIALVSHAWHLPRAVAEFEAQGLSVLPAPTAFTVPAGSQGRGWLALVPQADSLLRSRLAMHEWFGRGVYWLTRD